MRRVLLLIFILGTSSMMNAQSGSPQSPQIAIKLKLGETISVDNHFLTFTELREDSRCPKYTTCIWAGRARVIVKVERAGSSPKEFMVFIGEVMEDESPNRIVVDSENYILEVEQLKPYPGDETHTETTPTLLLIKKEKED